LIDYRVIDYRVIFNKFNKFNKFDIFQFIIN